MVDDAPRGPGAKPLSVPLTPAAIEQRILDVAASFAVGPPTRHQGTNSQYWRFTYRGRVTEFHVVSPEANTATPPTGGVAWLLRIQEPDPPLFAAEVGRLFKPGSGLARAMSGGVRTQFKSTDWESGA